MVGRGPRPTDAFLRFFAFLRARAKDPLRRSSLRGRHQGRRRIKDLPIALQAWILPESFVLAWTFLLVGCMAMMMWM